ncbi:MAG: amidohydrolase family protein [Opitutaceae bacterium]
MLRKNTTIIDCQCHLFPPKTLTRLRSRTTDPRLIREGNGETLVMGAWRRRLSPSHKRLDRLVATMDAAGITRTALSPNDPGPEWFGRDAPKVARETNTFIARSVERHPDRLIGLGVLPLPAVEPSLREIDHAVDELGLKGFLLYSNLKGRLPDDPRFESIFARLESLGLPLFIHPAKPVWVDPLADLEMIAAVGNMFEDTVALLRLILSGVLDRHPGLRLVCPHLGGALPFLIGRIEHQMTVLKRGPRHLKKRPVDYLRQVTFDIVSPQPSAIRLMLDLVGPGQLVFGSDYPWVQPSLVLDTLESLRLKPAELRAILFENAQRLFD